MSIANSMFSGLASSLEDAVGVALVRFARSKPGRVKAIRDTWREHLKELAVEYAEIRAAAGPARELEAVISASLVDVEADREKALRAAAAKLGIGHFITPRYLKHLLELPAEEATERLEAVAAAAI